MATKQTGTSKHRFRRWLLPALLLIIFLSALGYLGYQHFQELYARIQPLKVYEPKGKVAKRPDRSYAAEILKMIQWNPHANENETKIGYVAIPSQHILLPIYVNPYSSQTLNLGAASVKGQQLGQPSNYSLAAHNFNNHVTGFSPLQLTENQNAPYLTSGGTHDVHALDGTKVYAADKENLYVYRVVVQNTVYKDQVSVMDPANTVGKQPTLTIISCLFPNINYRIITRAVLSEKYPLMTAPKALLRIFDMRLNQTNAHVNWFNPGQEEGANGAMGGFKK
ncbi:MAG: class A sortase [Oenococcus sp.]|uniref:class A sortase n=1 Tax=Oenococcus TaxID=46254 RepID=UPI0021E8A6A4|nr:class A sortase [Oenococcus kitaharae]MCV3296642.1 class A sortase [Oenococcus kitaharae]